MPQSIKQNTISGVKWSAIEAYANQGIKFLLGMVMARLLLPSDYGIIEMVAVFFAVAQSFVDSGFGDALIRKQDRTETDFSTVFYFNIAVSVACYLILFFAAPYIATFFKEPVLTDVVRVVGLTVVINSFKIVQHTRYVISIDFKSIAKVTLVSQILSGLIGIALAYNGFGVWSLVYQNLLFSILSCVIMLWMSKWRPLLKFSIKSFKEMFNYGSKMLAAGLVHTLYININTFCIGKFYTPTDLGYYTRGCQFPQLLGGSITTVTQRVTFPILAKIQDDDERLISVYRKYIKMISMVIIFALMLLVALGKPLILFLLTDRWIDAVIFLQIFTFAMMTDHVAQINLNLLKVKGRSDLILRLEIIKKTISFIILFASIPFGVVAICLSKVVYSQIATIINTYYTGKLFGLGYLKQWGDFGGYFVYSLLACLPAFGLTFLPLPHLITLITGITISIILYIIVLLISRDDSFKEIYIDIKQKLFQRNAQQ